MTQPTPVNVYIAIIASLLPYPALILLDRLNSSCGDGLCGFLSGLLMLGALVVATIVFLIRSARRNEQPAALRWLPLVLWMTALARLAI